MASFSSLTRIFAKKLTPILTRQSNCSAVAVRTMATGCTCFFLLRFIGLLSVFVYEVWSVDSRTARARVRVSVSVRHAACRRQALTTADVFGGIGNRRNERPRNSGA